MTIGAFATVLIVGGYSRAISNDYIREIAHTIKNAQHREGLRLEVRS